MQSTTTHTSWDANEIVPFPVPLGELTEVFAHAIWGLKIDSVQADGSDIAAQVHDVDMEDADFRTVPVGEPPFVYKVRMSALIFASTVGEQEFELVKFKVPQEAKEITFVYRLRGPNQSLGEENRLTSKLFE